MKIVDILFQHRNWQDIKYDNLFMMLSTSNHIHECEISLNDIRTPWQRIKFCIWIYKTLGGKK